MRVISGIAKGHKLKAAAGSTVRPTADKVKEAMFNILAPELTMDLNVLDLFAGSGALGIEALSRGAKSATFVDTNKKVLEVLRQNLKNCKINDKATVILWDIRKNLSCLRAYPTAFDLVFMDPPYQQDLIPLAIKNLCNSNCLAPGAIIVAEHEPGAPIDLEEAPVIQSDTRKYGSNQITFFQLT